MFNRAVTYLITSYLSFSCDAGVQVNTCETVLSLHDALRRTPPASPVTRRERVTLDSALALRDDLRVDDSDEESDDAAASATNTPSSSTSADTRQQPDTTANTNATAATEAPQPLVCGLRQTLYPIQCHLCGTGSFCDFSKLSRHLTSCTKKCANAKVEMSVVIARLASYGTQHLTLLQRNEIVSGAYPKWIDDCGEDQDDEHDSLLYKCPLKNKGCSYGSCYNFRIFLCQCCCFQGSKLLTDAYR